MEDEGCCGAPLLGRFRGGCICLGTLRHEDFSLLAEMESAVTVLT